MRSFFFLPSYLLLSSIRNCKVWCLYKFWSNSSIFWARNLCSIIGDFATFATLLLSPFPFLSHMCCLSLTTFWINLSVEWMKKNLFHPAKMDSSFYSCCYCFVKEEEKKIHHFIRWWLPQPNRTEPNRTEQNNSEIIESKHCEYMCLWLIGFR